MDDSLLDGSIRSVILKSISFQTDDGGEIKLKSQEAFRNAIVVLTGFYLFIMIPLTIALCKYSRYEGKSKKPTY